MQTKHQSVQLSVAMQSRFFMGELRNVKGSTDAPKLDERVTHTWPSMRATALVFEARARHYGEDYRFGKWQGAKTRLGASCSQQNIISALDARVSIDKINPETVFSPIMQGLQPYFWKPMCSRDV